MKYNKLEKSLAGALTCLFVGGQVYAHDDLGETTVVATRGELELDRVVDSFVVRDPEKFSGSLSSALDSLSGVISESTAGQRGGSTGLFIRGMRSNDTQLRIDGVRVTNRSFSLNTILGQMGTGGFERVEVLKGGNSALYGAGATAGVVNLTSKSGPGNLSGIEFELGSFDTLRSAVEFAGGNDKLSYYYRESVEYTNNDTWGGNSEIPGFDNDFRVNSRNFSVEYVANDDLTIGATYRAYDSSFESPQFFGSLTESKLETASLYADFWLTDSWSSKVTLGWFRDDSDFVTFGSGSDYEQFSLAWENNYKLSDATRFAFGLEYEDQDYDNGTTIAGDDYIAAYVNANHAFNEHFTVQTGLRYEDFDAFGEQVNWSAGGKYHLAKHTAVRAKVGTGFRAPTYIDLFSPTRFGLTGNPNLEAEDSLSWELALSKELGEGHEFEVVYFEADVENLIVNDFVGGTPVNTPGKSKANGVEVSFKGSLSQQWDYEASYTWLDNAFSGQPEQSARLAAVYSPSEAWQTGFVISYVDQRTFNGSPLSDYIKTDLFGKYQINENVSVHARVENLFNEKYEHAIFGMSSYPAKRRAFYVGAKYVW